MGLQIPIHDSLDDWYIFKPCNMDVKFTHNMKAPNDSEVPRFKLKVNVESLDFALNSQQTQQVFAVKQNLERLALFEKLFPYRPKKSVKEDPKAWWCYAKVFVLEEYLHKYSGLREVVNVRKRYINLYQKKLEDEESLAGEEVKCLEDIELQLPSQTIVMFRVQAHNNFRRKSITAKEESKGGRRSNKLVLKSPSVKKKSAVTDSVEEYWDLEAEVEDTSSFPEHYPILEMDVEAKATLALSEDDLNLIFLTVIFGLSLQTFPNNKMVMSSNISDFQVSDEYTEDALYASLAVRCGPEETSTRIQHYKDTRGMSVKQTKKMERFLEKRRESVRLAQSIEQPVLKVELVTLPGSIDVVVLSMPIEIRINKDCIFRTIECLTPPAKTKEHLKDLVNKQLAAARAAASQLQHLSVKIDAFTPKILIPVESNKDKGIIVLDIGYVEVEGNSIVVDEPDEKNVKKNDGRMFWEVFAHDLQAELALRKSHLKNRSIDTKIIDNFDVKLYVNRNASPKGARNFLELEVGDPIKVTLSPERLNKVIYVSTHITYPTEEDTRRRLILDSKRYHTGPAFSKHKGLSDVTKHKEHSDVTEHQFEDVLNKVINIYSEGEETKDDDPMPGEDPTRPVLEMDLSVSLVEIHFVTADPSVAFGWQRWNTLTVQKPNLFLTKNLFDLELLLSVEALTFQDLTKSDESSYRWIFKDPQSLISLDESKVEAGGKVESSRQVTILITLFRSPKAPGYDQEKKYDKLIELNVTRLDMQIDPKMAERLAPYFKAIMEHDHLLDDTAAVNTYLNFDDGGSPRSRHLSDNSFSVMSHDHFFTKSGIHLQVNEVDDDIARMVDRKLNEMKNAEAGKSHAIHLTLSYKGSIELGRPQTSQGILSFDIEKAYVDLVKRSGKFLDMELTVGQMKVTDVRAEALSKIREVMVPTFLGVPGVVPAPERTDATQKLITICLTKRGAVQDLGIKCNEFSFFVVLDAYYEAYKAAYGFYESLMIMLDLQDKPVKKGNWAEPIRRPSIVPTPASRPSSCSKTRPSTSSSRRLSMVERLSLLQPSVLRSVTTSQVDDTVNISDKSPSISLLEDGVFFRPRRNSEPGRTEQSDSSSFSKPTLPENQQHASSLWQRTQQALRSGSLKRFPQGMTEDEPREGSVASSAATETNTPERRLNLKVECTNPKFYLIENPSAPSRAIFLKFNAVLIYNKTTANHNKEEIIDASMDNFVPYIDTDIQTVKLCPQLSEPAFFHCKVNLKSQRGIRYFVDVIVNIPAFFLRISYRDGMLLKGVVEDMLSRKSKIMEAKKKKQAIKTMEIYHPEKALETAVSSNVLKKKIGKKGSKGHRVLLQHINITLTKIQVIVINDFQGNDQPVLLYEISNLGLDLDGCPGNLRGFLSVPMRMDFYNSQLMEYEPLVEQWNPSMEITQQGDVDAETCIAMNATTPLLVNVSTEFLKTMLESHSLLLSNASQEGRETKDIVEHSPIHFYNDTGLPVTLELSDQSGKRIEVDPGNNIPLVFKKIEKHGQSFLDLEDQKSVTLSFGDIASSRQPISGLKVHQHGAIAYQLYPLHSPRQSHYIYADPVVEETWEYQRLNILTQEWKLPFLPTDKGNWLDKPMRNKRPKDKIVLPDRNWVWLDEWHVDDTNPHTKDGWYYAFKMSDFVISKRIEESEEDSEFLQVRRRRWIRTRSPHPPPYSDIGRLLYMSWHSEINQSGKIAITARSLILLKNSTSTHFEVMVFHVSENEGKVIGDLNAKMEMSVPVLDAYCSHLQVRPMNSSHKWSQPALSIMKTPFTMERTAIVCTPDESTTRKQWSGDHSFYFNAHVNTMQDHITVNIYALIELVNILPCNLKYRCTSDTASALDKGVLSPADTAYLKQIDVTQNPCLAIKIGRYLWSQDLPLLDGLKDEELTEKTFSLANGEGQYLSIKAKITMSANRKIQVTISCKYWLVNKSGLPIEFGLGKDKLIPPKDADFAEELDFEGSLQIVDLRVKSKGRYNVIHLNDGVPLYTDKSFKWSNLPSHFQNMQYICTCFADRHCEGEELFDFMVFLVNQDAVVHVLFDGRGADPPTWLVHSGFKKTDLTITTEHKDHLLGGNRLIYDVWERFVSAWSPVRLGPNGKHAKAMYSVIVSQEPINQSDDINGSFDTCRSPDYSNPSEVGQYSPSSGTGRMAHLADNVWALGMDGLFLYSPPEHRERVGVCIGESWSEDLDISKGVDKGIFQIHSGNKIYDLTLSTKALPGMFRKSQMILIAPHYMVVNCLSEPIEVKQDGTSDDESLNISPNSKGTFHWADQHKDQQVLIKIKHKTQWAYGSIKIDRVGVTPLHLPSARGGLPVVVNVQVRLGRSSEDCAIMIAVSQAASPPQHLIRVQNDCRYPVRFRQEEAPFGLGWALYPSQAVNFGWLYPLKPKILVLTIDSKQKGVGYYTIKTDKMNEEVKLNANGYTLFVKVGIEGATKTICIVEDMAQLQPPPPPPSTKLAFKVALKAIGVSIIANTTQRREDFFLYIKKAKLHYHKNSNEDGFECKIESVQMDNHIPGALFPVIFLGQAQQEDNKLPFFHFSVARAPSKGSKSIFIRYFALQMLKSKIQIDRTTLEEFLQFFGPLKLVSSDEALAMRSSHQWVNEFTRDLLESDPWGRIDIDQVNKSAQLSRMYFEQLLIHPFKFDLTFIQVPTELKDVHSGFNILELLRDAVTIENAHIQLKSFLVEHAVESKQSLISIVGKHYVLQLTSQILPVLGSISAFGNPADLLTGVGTGVHDFFYEPFQGAVQSPKHFVDGLGKGTSSLLKHVVGGTLSSIAGVGAGLSRGVAFLSFDPEYTTKRDKRKIEERVKKGGMKDGFSQAGNSLLGGFVEGLGGVLMKPYTEAKKNGPGGFVAGVGMGAAGLLVKPIVGVADAAVSVVQGISNEVGTSENLAHVRLRRALLFRPDKGGHVLQNYSGQSADAQRLVAEAEIAATKHTHPTLNHSTYPCDVYHLDVAFGTFWIIFSKLRLLILNLARNPEKRKHQVLEWAEISHCLIKGGSLHIILVEGNSVVIPCPNEHLLYQLYAQLESEASKMSDTSRFVPLDDILARKGGSGSFQLRRGLSSDTGGYLSIEGYTFGAGYGKDTPAVSGKQMSNGQIIADAKKKMHDQYKDGEWAALDKLAWELICTFKSNNRNLSLRNCLLVAIVNDSPLPVQVHSVEMDDGRDYHLVPSKSYNEASRNLQPKGSIIVFAWSKRVSVFHQGNIALKFDTSGFTCQVQMSRQPQYQALMGFKVSCLEASIENKEWNKLVFAIKQNR